jgi:hypothetical protein
MTKEEAGHLLLEATWHKPDREARSAVHFVGAGVDGFAARHCASGRFLSELTVLPPRRTLRAHSGLVSVALGGCGAITDRPASARVIVR